MDNFSVLPEGCISQILSMTSPRDACRSSAIPSGFGAAANSDSVWEKFLPSDHRQIISRSVSPVVFFSTKKQLYFSLCDSPLLLGGGKLLREWFVHVVILGRQMWVQQLVAVVEPLLQFMAVDGPLLQRVAMVAPIQ
ncbi:hypothetical protein RHMOL_Rhmol09G0065100 [Rhododendron molle]|uniref:Uncharacterized protein n=1 Tax=Rhododendron molle TaxID=49168 RepID=A0ACC0MBN9_RHOML|nr:hypothetical protein RHMOL_Rhmol09G0065100 [Rhododendron molle]